MEINNLSINRNFYRNENAGKYPKTFPELTEEQKWIRDDFVKYLYTIFPNKFLFLERFNNNYIIKNQPSSFTKTLEIGAGLGAHIFEQLSNLQRQNYVGENMAEGIQNNHPVTQVWVGDCQEKNSAPIMSLIGLLIPMSWSIFRIYLKPLKKFIVCAINNRVFFLW